MASAMSRDATPSSPTACRTNPAGAFSLVRELNETYTATLTPGATNEFRADVDAWLVTDGYAGIESIDCG